MIEPTTESGGFDEGVPLFIILVLIIIFVAAIFETGLIAYSFLNADKVECDWWHCVATKTTRIENVSINRSCSQNGITVDCNSINGFDFGTWS